MEFAYSLDGSSTPFIKRYQVNATLSTPGIPVIPGGTGGTNGVAAATTTAAVNLVGVTLDTTTYVSSQQTDGSDCRRTVSVVINPLAVYRAKLIGGATANTALGTVTNSTASTTGTVVTYSATATNAMDEGTIFCYSGANAGQYRKNLTGITASATVGVPFNQDIAVGDVFIQLPFFPTESQYPQLSTNLDQVDGSVDTDTDNANFRVVELDLRDVTDSGLTNSFVYLIGYDSLFQL